MCRAADDQKSMLLNGALLLPMQSATLASRKALYNTAMQPTQSPTVLPCSALASTLPSQPSSRLWAADRYR